MQWFLINTQEHRKQVKECWHLWFAWFPIKIKIYPDGAVVWAWWCRVKRKGEYKQLLGYSECGWVYKYKWRIFNESLYSRKKTS